MNDESAPLLFINGRDLKAAQTFSLLHGYLHICLGESGVDDVEVWSAAETRQERWCNRVVAEALMPQGIMNSTFDPSATPREELANLAAQWKANPLAVCRQAREIGLIDPVTFEAEYGRFKQEAQAYAISSRSGGNGNYYRTLGARLGSRFARAVVRDTLDGGTLLRDAYQLVGCKKHQKFMNFCAGFKGE